MKLSMPPLINSKRNPIATIGECWWCKYCPVHPDIKLPKKWREFVFEFEAERLKPIERTMMRKPADRYARVK